MSSVRDLYEGSTFSHLQQRLFPSIYQTDSTQISLREQKIHGLIKGSLYLIEQASVVPSTLLCHQFYLLSLGTGSACGVTIGILQESLCPLEKSVLSEWQHWLTYWTGWKTPYKCFYVAQSLLRSGLTAAGSMLCPKVLVALQGGYQGFTLGKEGIKLVIQKIKECKEPLDPSSYYEYNEETQDYERREGIL